jgi:tripartite-type tricarboxylate transporter receptor subunit TctC
MKFLAGLCALLLAAAAAAQGFPTKPMRIVVPYPPGGGTDVLARLVGKHMGDSFRQPVVVENRAGGNATIGMDYVAKAPADGHTLLAIAAGPLDNDSLPRFAPVALMTAPAYIMVVNPAVPARSVMELVAHARANPGKLAYGSTGGGAASHLATELFKAMAGIDLLHVPYKGIGNAVSDLLGGQVQLMIAPSQAVIQHARAGKLRALAVSGATRSPASPELPTVAEAGIAGYEASGWFGLVTTSGVPREVVAQLNAEVNRILQLAEVRARLLELGAEPARSTPESFLEFIRRDNAKWAALIRERSLVIEKPQ